MIIWSRVKRWQLVGHRFEMKWQHAHWELQLWCGCAVVRHAHIRGGEVSLPPKRCRCESMPGCKRHVNTLPEGTGASAEEST